MKVWPCQGRLIFNVGSETAAKNARNVNLLTPELSSGHADWNDSGANMPEQC